MDAPHSLRNVAPLRFSIALFLLLGAAQAREFDLQRDTFAFANETAWGYRVDHRGELHIGTRKTPARYAHGCFVLARAVLQFHQFAHFAPDRPRVSSAEYRRLIRAVCRIPVWSRGPRERIVIPGFADLRSFSLAHPRLLQENLGAWVPTYLRPGNYRMAMGHPRAGQAMVARWLEASVRAGRPRALYLSRFPHMNHAVVAYAAEREPDGNVRFLVYDPNYPGQPASLRYVHQTRSFAFQKRWYFPGGGVNAMRLYLSPLH